MKEDYKIKIFNLIILDKSGSMRVIERAAVEGFNDVLEGIRVAHAESEVQDHYVSLLTFCDCKKEYIYDCVPVNKVRNLTLRDYNPCCGTPLFDAMGKGLNDLVRRVENEKHAIAVVTIITDGEENASREYNGEYIKSLVDKLQHELDWKFSYIGTNQDVEAIGNSMAIKNNRYFEYSNAGVSGACREERISREKVYCCIESNFMKGNEPSNDLLSKIRKMFDKPNTNKQTTPENTIGLGNDQISEIVNERILEVRKLRQQKNQIRKWLQQKSRMTPDNIANLDKNQVFVFGSNEQGMHGGGAALTAVKKFGAIMGQGEGLQGQSYAIPTMEGIDNMRKAIDRFIEYAKEHPELTFLVTRIGCGIAGYREEEVAPLFADAKDVSNIYLPSGFWDEINK